MKTTTDMSLVIVGRLPILTLKVINPASSFETTTVVMSGASGFSPVESVYVVEFDLAADLTARDDAGAMTVVAASARTSVMRAPTV
jgi:hypothetical protein